MNYEKALEYIHSVNWKGSRPGLERITELCERLGNPQNGLRFIHVAGTNGKGSFCAMLESILRAAGYEAGTFTSPYIYRFEERMCVGGKPISPEELAEITSYVAPHADAMEDAPTEFELITAIGFEFFRRRNCRVVILETGMGGRLDSTNVIPAPILSVITGISLDHTEFLGDTTEAIAAEKAGIIKPGSMVLWGGDDPDAERVILDKATECGCKCFGVDYSLLRDVKLSIDGTTFSYGRYEGLTIPLLGTYQPYNAARVITATEILRQGGVKITDDAVRIGLQNTKWHGRFELMMREPEVFFDGAHNPEGMEHAIAGIKGYYPDKKIALIIGVMKDKDYRGMAKLCAPVTGRAFTVTPDNPRALPAEELAQVFANEGIYSTAFTSIEGALTDAYSYAKKNGVPVFCLGSLYSYPDFRRAVKKKLQ
ncbi:MAG: bifunctional folylpolyglutamate synthase/dihydrofolate synthase [Clostridia bacterium]|nr:bifunctional folylpolyglutamate synthase/dihydrofolate synthase [Clostridia bacterium]